MSWNYRIIKKEYGNEVEYAIYEVYYNKRGVIDGWSENPTCVAGNSLNDLAKDFQLYAEAFSKPVLKYYESEEKLREEE